MASNNSVPHCLGACDSGHTCRLVAIAYRGHICLKVHQSWTLAKDRWELAGKQTWRNLLKQPIMQHSLGLFVSAQTHMRECRPKLYLRESSDRKSASVLEENVYFGEMWPWPLTDTPKICYWGYFNVFIEYSNANLLVSAFMVKHPVS